MPMAATFYLKYFAKITILSVITNKTAIPILSFTCKFVWSAVLPLFYPPRTDAELGMKNIKKFALQVD